MWRIYCYFDDFEIKNKTVRFSFVDGVENFLASFRKILPKTKTVKVKA